MTRLGRLKIAVLTIILTLSSTMVLAACEGNDTTTEREHGKVAEIKERGTLLVGTTGDYRPLSFREADGTYWGFCIDIAKEIASRLGVSIEFIQTSWPTLTADVTAEPQLFDLAIGGITITDAYTAASLY